MGEHTTNHHGQPQEHPHHLEHASHKLSGEDKIFASLGYISILFIVPLILRHDQEEVYFHARQGMVLFGTEVIVWFLLFILESFFAALLPTTNLGITAMFGAVAWLLFVVLSVMGMYGVYRGKRIELPILGKIAKKIEV